MPGIESGGLLAAEDRLAKGIREEVVEVEIQVREDTRMFAATSIDWERAIDAELKIMGHVVEPRADHAGGFMRSGYRPDDRRSDVRNRGREIPLKGGNEVPENLRYLLT